MGSSNGSWIGCSAFLGSKCLVLPAIFCAGGLLPLAAQSRFSAEYQATDVLNAAGGLVESGAYSNNFSLGGITGESSAGEIKNRSGYIGQLFDVVSIGFPADASALDEGSLTSLRVAEEWDDGTFGSFVEGEVLWRLVSGAEYASLSAEGLLETKAVYEDTEISVEAHIPPTSVILTMVVRDVDVDNFGMYAGDGLPDWWQVLYFGIDNPLAAPHLDPDGDGKDNAAEFFAGTIPTIPGSAFVAILEQDNIGEWYLRFQSVPDRWYWLETSTPLTPDSWVELEGPLSGNGEELSFPLPAPGEAGHFHFRVKMRP